jgi:hypothetical protein
LIEEDPCGEHYDRIQSLKLEIERILEINSISLEQQLRNSQAQESSIEGTSWLPFRGVRPHR